MADHDPLQPSEITLTPASVSMREPPITGDQFANLGMDRLSRAFETSARRWELIVYPTLFAFIILAAYGFYLVFSLAKDMHYLTISVDSNMTVMASNMQALSDNIGQLTANVRTMTVSVDAMAHHVESMARDVSALEPMSSNMEQMNQSMQTMSYTMQNVRNDVAMMNQSIGQGIARPMSFFNTFMPW